MLLKIKDKKTSEVLSASCSDEVYFSFSSRLDEDGNDVTVVYAFESSLELFQLKGEWSNVKIGNELDRRYSVERVQ